jgi:hypothetical protein
MMSMNRWLWVLWGAMIISMLLKWQAETYILVAVIVLPILIVLLDLHEEIVLLKEENKHQRKFVMDRYNVLQDKLKDISSNVEKRMVVDFAEFARNSANENNPERSGTVRSGVTKKRRKKKKRPVEETVPVAVDFNEIHEEIEEPVSDSDDFYPDDE